MSAPNNAYANLDLTGKRLIVTGGASGMGKQAALLFAGRGAKVVLADLYVDGGVSVNP